MSIAQQNFPNQFNSSNHGRADSTDFFRHGNMAFANRMSQLNNYNNFNSFNFSNGSNAPQDNPNCIETVNSPVSMKKNSTKFF